MKLTLLSNNLQHKLSFLSRGISSKNQLPVLQNILLEAKSGKLVISSTDLEIGIQTVVPASIEEEGSVTTPAKTFIDIISNLSSEKINIQTVGSTLEVITSKTKSSFQTTQADEFPKLFEEKGQELLSTKKDLLQKDFTKVLFAASLDVSRPALSGIYLKKEILDNDKTIIIVATDGYRLSLKQSASFDNKRKTEKKDKDLLEKPLLIPVRILKEALSLKEEVEDIKIYLSEEKNQVLFEQGETIIVGRLINADFPNYEKIIPQESSIKALFDREEMLKAVKMASIFARDAANIVRFSIKKDKIVVSANAPQVGENTVDVEAKITGEENEIAFNVRYLLEFLSVMEEDDIVFEMTTPIRPGVFKIKGDNSFLHIIMPIRVQTEA